jgi:inorganic pyrophosphatase
MYPLVASAMGILICILTAFIGIYITKVNRPDQIERTLKYQLVISTILLTPVMIGTAYWCFPDTFYMTPYTILLDQPEKHPWHAFVCTISGCTISFNNL